MASFLAGVLLLVAAPPMNVAACVWLALAGLAYLLDEPGARGGVGSGWMGGTGRGLAFGMGANLVAFRFMPGVVTHFTTLGSGAALGLTALLALLHALRWGLAGCLHVQLARRGVPSPLAFAAALYISTFVPAMIPWMPVDGATSWLSAMQLAEAVGERGVQAIVAMVAALIALGVRRRRAGETRRPLELALAAVAIHLLLVLFGTLRLAALDARLATLPHVKVALVAPDVAATLRWDESEAPQLLSRLTDLTRSAEAAGAAFTVWPEAAYPFLLEPGAALPLVGERAPVPAPLHGPVLSGVMVRAPDPGALTNSATVFARDGLPAARYDKVHLLWFGETVPLAEEIPWIKRTFARGTGIVAGTKQVSLSVGPARVAVLDCFEDTLRRGPGDRAGDADAAEQRGRDVGDTLCSQFDIAAVDAAGHAVRHHRREQALDRAEQGERQRSRQHRHDRRP